VLTTARRPAADHARGSAASRRSAITVKPVTEAIELTTRRLTLVVLDERLLRSIYEDDRASPPFRWPPTWPDEVDRRHLAIWIERAPALVGRDAWRPRALVDGNGMIVGHAGFHLPPQPLEQALRDATFHGIRPPTPGGVVEIGYTVFPDFRRLGYACEAVACLVDWAFDTGDVSAILATVAPDNVASLRVLDRVGGFRRIGTCRDRSGAEEIVLRRDAPHAV
jgi:RimJ/RimL family protein N-acetyltransferase